jgi:hypothetical protein
MKQSEVDPQLVADLWKQHRDAKKVGELCGLSPSSVGQVVARMRSHGMELPPSLSQEKAELARLNTKLKNDQFHEQMMRMAAMDLDQIHRSRTEPKLPKLTEGQIKHFADVAMEHVERLFMQKPEPNRPAKLMLRLVNGCRQLPDEGLTPQTAALRELAEAVYLLFSEVLENPA